MCGIDFSLDTGGGVVFHDFLGSAGERSGADEAWNDGFDFRVIEDEAVGFIAEESRTSMGVLLSEDFAWDVNFFRLDSGGSGDEVVDLVPGEPLVTGDVKCFSDCGGVSHQPHKSFRKIGVVGEGP